MRTIQKMLRGWCSWRVLPGFGNLLDQICTGYITWTCWDFFTILHNKFRASCGRPQCVLPSFAETCSSSSSIPITQSPPSPLSKPPPSSRFACPIFCVRRDERLSIDRPVCPFFAWLASSCCCCWLRLIHRCCYTSSRHIITLRLLVGVGPAAQRFGEWASASRTFSAITDLVALVQREVDRLFVFIF